MGRAETSARPFFVSSCDALATRLRVCLGSVGVLNPFPSGLITLGHWALVLIARTFEKLGGHIGLRLLGNEPVTINET